MSQPRAAQPAKLVIGLLLGDKALLSPAAEALKKIFGSIHRISPWFAFDFTDYYQSEMGSPLIRRMLVFERLIDQQQLSSIKHATNKVEKDFAMQGRRRINIDPGYLLMERFVLATGKNYSHRIYVGDRIYADLTLIYQDGDYQALPWTYPDYADPDIRSFLRRVRGLYGEDLKALSKDRTDPAV